MAFFQFFGDYLSYLGLAFIRNPFGVCLFIGRYVQEFITRFGDLIGVNLSGLGFAAFIISEIAVILLTISLVRFIIRKLKGKKKNE